MSSIKNPFFVPDETISRILDESRSVAVVGISDKLGRPSLTVSSYLQDHGFTVLPVNPTLESVAHVKCYPSLESLPTIPDLCVIFRKAADIPSVIEETVRKGIRRVWVQEGIQSPEGYRISREKGQEIVMDHCIMKECIRLQKPSNR
ncbi:MAG: CoA-binding protein [Leptospirales bacterium]